MKPYVIPRTRPKIIIDNVEPEEIQIDKDAMIEIVSDAMYSNPSDGLRELYANAVRACKEAKEKHGTNPTIMFVLNESQNSLIITEQDSMGMTREVFQKIYKILGKSGNHDGTSPGQFGIGAISYKTLSPTMLLESWSRQTGERMCFLCKDGKTFHDIIKLNAPTLQQYGVKITLKIDWEKIGNNMGGKTNKMDAVINYIKLLCKNSGITSILKYTKKRENQNVEQIGPIPIEEQITADTILKTDDYDLYVSYSDNAHHPAVVTLAGIPISSEQLPDLISTHSSVLLNIKNERKYRPIASRQRLRDESADKLNEKIMADLYNVATSTKLDLKKWVNCTEPNAELITLFYHFDVDFHIKAPKLFDFVRMIKSKCWLQWTLAGTPVMVDNILLALQHVIDDLKFKLSDVRFIESENGYDDVFSNMPIIYPFNHQVKPELKKYIRQTSINKLDAKTVWNCFEACTHVYKLKQEPKNSDILCSMSKNEIKEKMEMLYNYGVFTERLVTNGKVGISARQYVEKALTAEYDYMTGHEIFKENINIVDHDHPLLDKMQTDDKFLAFIIENDNKETLILSEKQSRPLRISAALTGKRLKYFSSMGANKTLSRYYDCDFTGITDVKSFTELLSFSNNNTMFEFLHTHGRYVARQSEEFIKDMVLAGNEIKDLKLHWTAFLMHLALSTKIPVGDKRFFFTGLKEKNPDMAVMMANSMVTNVIEAKFGEDAIVITTNCCDLNTWLVCKTLGIGFNYIDISHENDVFIIIAGFYRRN